MRSIVNSARALAVLMSCAVLAAGLPSVVPAQSVADRESRGAITYGDVAAQLGIVVPSDAARDFEIGSQFTGTLKEPEKLEQLGISGMREGARVIALRIAPDRVRIEADQLDHAPARASAVLRLNAQGRLLPRS